MSNLMKKMPLIYDTETERVDGVRLHYYLQESINEAIKTTRSHYNGSLDDDGENVLSPTYKYYDAIPYDADLHISHFKSQDDDENKISSQNMEDNIFTSLNDISNIVRISFLLLPILLLLIFLHRNIF